VKQLGLIEADDREVWSYARSHGYCILTKDKDFQQMSGLMGHPPKVVWLRCGNTSTTRLAELILDMAPGIFHFLEHKHRSLLILAAPGS
jgi:predicted nuclease of predicted toxin-antitoxin system